MTHQPRPLEAAKAAMADQIAAARRAGRALAEAGPQGRTAALHAMVEALRAAETDILNANARDVAGAEAAGQPAAFLDRLRLDPDRLKGVIDGVAAVAAQPDPVGAERRRWSRPNGLSIAEVTVPLGVIGVIFESRPNVAADAAALCVRAANGVILRTGREASETVSAIVGAVRNGLAAAGLDPEAVQTPPDPGRAYGSALLSLTEGGADLVIPRGGKSLIAHVRETARVPVLSHLDGICHVYLHEAADSVKALAITLDSKMRRVGVCNAAETLLVDQAAADRLLPPIAAALMERGCALRGDGAARALVPAMETAQEADWEREYLDAILSVRVVDGLAAAVDHIARYGSAHTDAIVTEDPGAAQRFLEAVDSAVVLHNASTAFADGGEFGFGAEIGIATGRLHARGPVGAEHLVTHKCVVQGDGQVRG